LSRPSAQRRSRALAFTVAEVVDEADALPSFYDCPAEHWIHLRTTKEPRHEQRERHHGGST
jgi:hypothetical protein